MIKCSSSKITGGIRRAVSSRSGAGFSSRTATAESTVRISSAPTVKECDGCAAAPWSVAVFKSGLARSRETWSSGAIKTSRRAPASVSETVSVWAGFSLESTVMKAFQKIFVVAALIGGAFLSTGAHAQTKAKAQFIVCIDPGHPSETSAGANAGGLSENRLNWNVSVRLAQKLNKAGIAWVSTKQSLNQKVTNKRRAEIANEIGRASCR